MKQKTTHLSPPLFISLLLLSASACVSKRSHLETLAAHDRQVAGLHAQLDSTAKAIYRLELEVATRKGENAALLATQDKMQDRIANLRDEADLMKKEAAFTVEGLDGRLQQKNTEITARQAKIDGLKATLEQRNAAMNQLALDLRDTLRLTDASVYDLDTPDGQVVLSFKADFLFAAGATNRISTAGQQALSAVAHVFSLYPTLEVLVVGHTDNAPLRRTSIRDKWEFSALRAVTVVQHITSRSELSPSRVSAVGKGDFSPRASNATPEGRARNERIELRAFPSEERLLRDLRRAVE